MQSFREPHASAIARLDGALGLSDEQIKAMTAAPALTALSTLKLGIYRHSATAIEDLSTRSALPALREI
ncbi:hypothetical protein CN074_31110 [Sinorhizobium medicae]|nr:hypothetical protein [Sinorhizobium medicae]MQX46467.1 hypothetical protein [Sinorhizobium medicae]MQX46472.1 hypothetical protein [Sinorhizobium medicae]MQX47287.1 hypothetical protein [Sinorhizobium medicae]MQX50504.1 hypothetical protein [Sinorhizobium medicae]